MPELPDVEAYLWALRRTVQGHTLRRVRLRSVFLFRTIEPYPEDLAGSRVVTLSRIGKRLVIGFERVTSASVSGRATESIWLVLHLMISGRLEWSKPGAGLPGKMGLCALDFDHGSLLITEASTKKRASVHLFTDRADIERQDPGGLEISSSTVDDFANAIRRRNHTLKRALTDPRILSGIGGAYADEIMHRAGLSPLRWTSTLDDNQMEALFAACREVLTAWTERLIAKSGEGWPDITAFQPEMAVHGKFGKPCPRCGDPVQRIVYASRETNYCATCQTKGKLLADRAMSRILRKDWPRTLEDLEELSGPEARWTTPEH